MNQLETCLDVVFERDQVGSRSYLALPSRENPQYLLPTYDRRAVSAGLRFFNSSKQSRKSSLAVRTLGLGMGLPIPSARSISPGRVRNIEALRGRDPQCPVSLVVRLGTKRANAKPVIAMVEDGVVVRVAKVGVTALSDELVEREASNLHDIAAVPMGTILRPRLVEFAHVAGHPLLIETALPAETGESLKDWQVREAAATIARSKGIQEQPLRESMWFASLSQRMASASSGERTTELMALIHAWERSPGCRSVVPIGTWHGDFTRWNATVIGQQVAVWDWERYGSPAPLGFDLLHWAFQQDFARNRSEPTAARNLVRAAPSILADEGYDVETAQMVARAFLLDIGARYADDVNEMGGGAAARVDRWLVPALLG